MATLLDAVPSGSYLAISHPSSDFLEQETQQGIGDSWNGKVQQQFTFRAHDQVARFFAGTDLVDPGLALVEEWRPSQAPCRKASRPCGGPWVANDKAAGVGLCQSYRVETASQTLHRLTSYQAFDPGDPGRVWEPPVDDPRVRQDLVVNDIARLPWFYKRYTQSLPRVPLPRHLPVTTAPAVDVLAGAGAFRALPWTCRSCRGYCTCRPGWCTRRSGRTGPSVPCRRVSGRPVPDGAVPSGCRRGPTGAGCPGTRGRALVTRRTTPWSRLARPRAGTHPSLSSRVFRGGQAGATASVATGTSTGTSARCCRSCSRPPSPRESPRGSTAVSR